MAPLGGDGGDVEHGVGVVEPGQHPVVPDGVVPVERDQDLVGGVDPLEAGQPVGQRGQTGLVGQTRCV